MKPWAKISLFVAMGVVGVFVIAVCVEDILTHTRATDQTPRCYETPSAADVGRTLSPPIHAHGTIYVCGLYSRTALPDVIRCYEMEKGCTK